MYELKTYQRTALDELGQYLEDAQFHGAMKAFINTLRQKGIENPLYRTYDLGDIPYVCLRLPTGGGKTILASYAIRDVAKKYLNRDKLLVLWLVPTTKIAEQTLDCLQRPGHPYRQAIDEYFGGKVSVFEIANVTNIRPQDLEQKVCVVVGTLASLRITDTNGRRIYAHNENYQPHFERIQKNLAGLETIEEGNDRGKPKFSFANLCHVLKPMVIMDEAHNARTSLSFDTLKRLSPSCIIELTATPDITQSSGSNVLYSVSALELKKEHMIKLPIMLTEHNTWQEAIANTVLTRKELAELAKKEKEYIRPIALYQAESKDKEVTVEVLKKYLMENENIDDSKIAVYTGAVKELEGIDLFSHQCGIEHIITVEALKEGWDCSFAYVFCSVANVGSAKDVEQLLGRVLRMPYARQRQNPALNCAYANVSSPSFSKAAQELRDALVNKMGFEPLEAGAFVLSGKSDNQNKTGQITIYDQQEPDTIKIDGLNTDLLSDTTKEAIGLKTEDGISTFQINSEIDDNAVEEIINASPEDKRDKIKKTVAIQRLGKTEKQAVISDKKESIRVPRLYTEYQGEIDFIESDTLLEAGEWNILDYKAELPDFRIDEKENCFEITISENEKVVIKESQTDDYYNYAISFPDITDKELVLWLERETRQLDIKQIDNLAFNRKIIEYIKNTQHYNLIQLFKAKFHLRLAIIRLIDKYRTEAKKKGYQLLLFTDENKVDVSFNYCFEFKPGDENYQPYRFYSGNWAFNKHLYANIGEMNSEEAECARAIDRLKEVKYWVRNIERQPYNSFWLPTSSDKFYPDFVGELNDGRILVIEYKGSLISTTDDTKEKTDIGALWEKKSNGKGIFIMCTKGMIEKIPTLIS